MRYIFCLFFSITSLCLTAQKTVRMDAVKANDYGVAYTLPKTVIEVIINYSKVSQTAGQYYIYANRYLNIANPVTENKVSYRVDDIQTNAIGVPNPQQKFLVEFRASSAMAYVTLSSNGMICAINADYEVPTKDEIPLAKPNKPLDANVHQYFSEEILRAGSSAKEAELIAKQIYRLRESRNDILTGEADNMPPDGSAYQLVMQQIDEQEQALTALFVGTEVIEPMRNVISIEPRKENIREAVIGRFSSKLGLVEQNDLAGEPIFLSLQAYDALQTVEMSEREQRDWDKKIEKAIVYNIPSKASLKIEYENKMYVNKECDVVQFGKQEVLDNKQFGDRSNPLKVIFFHDLGAIKQTGIAK